MANSELPEKRQLTATELRLQQNAEYFKEQDNVKEYVVESPRLDAQGLPVSEGRVLTSESFAKACDGILELTDRGEVVYKTCFAAGTSVHTDQGLVPIEKVRVGTRVLSQPEQGGEQDYRAVINTMAHLDQQVYAVQVKVDGADELTTLIATPNHPFWVESPVVDGAHWMATECLQSGFVLQLADSRKASVHAAGLIRSTQYPNIGFAADDRAGVGIVLDITDAQIALADDDVSFTVGKLEVGEPYLTPVYNFEVEEFHTYYVDGFGVWVHNNNCTEVVANKDIALDRQINRQDALNELNQGQPCFVAGTLVHTKEGLKPIEEIKSGDWVLSYPDDQTPPRHQRGEDEYVYREVIRTFVHEDKPVCEVTFLNFASNAKETVKVTLNHPFFVKNKGWMPASDLNFRCALYGANFGNLAVADVVIGDEQTRVYNFEVAEFHTYYVGRLGAWVHNMCGEFTQLPPLRDIASEQPISIFRDSEWQNFAETKSNSITGSVGELYAQKAIEAETGSKFLSEEVRNGGSNNGPDLWNLNESPMMEGQKAILTVLDAKASIIPKFPSPKTVALDARTRAWIEEVHATGQINGRPVESEIGRQQYERAWTLLQEGKLEIVTGLLVVEVPKPGTVGLLEVKYVANPNKYEEVIVGGAEHSAVSISTQEIAATVDAARQYWLDAGASASALSGVDVTIGNLAPRIAAMTLGNEITLSADGAGWGWFVDARPTAQEEYGAGDAANEFHALAGSAAENKMDLLTVLVHELGHVLGLGHVSGDDDLMAQFLTPGVRRLPSPADTATLVAQGAPRQSDSMVIGATYTLDAPASTTPNSAQTPSWHHEFVVSTGFATLHNLTPDWTTTGNVVVSDDVATLNEVRTSQTSLRQAFMVGTNDHEIAFTLEDRQLSGQTKGPNDAFSGAHVARGLPNLHLIST